MSSSTNISFQINYTALITVIRLTLELKTIAVIKYINESKSIMQLLLGYFFRLFRFHCSSATRETIHLYFLYAIM